MASFWWAKNFPKMMKCTWIYDYIFAWITLTTVIASIATFDIAFWVILYLHLILVSSPRKVMETILVKTDYSIIWASRWMRMKLITLAIQLFLIRIFGWLVGWNHPPIKLNKIDMINGVWSKPSHCRDSCLRVQWGIRSGLLSKHILYVSNFQ